MRNVRNFVYLAWFVLAALVNFGCQGELSPPNDSQQEEQMDVLRDYGGERTDFRPAKPQMP